MSRGVFLGSLPDEVGREDIEEWLQAEGFSFDFVRLMTDRAGGSKNCAIIRVATREDQERIIARFDGAPFAGTLLRASIAHPNPTQQQRRERSRR